MKKVFYEPKTQGLTVTEIEAFCRRVLVSLLGVLESDIPKYPWLDLTIDFAQKNKARHFSGAQIMKLFRAQAENLQAKTEMTTEMLFAIQKHHDFYLDLKQKGKLHPSEKPYLELALKREKEGLVRPLYK